MAAQLSVAIGSYSRSRKGLPRWVPPLPIGTNHSWRVSTCHSAALLVPINAGLRQVLNAATTRVERCDSRNATEACRHPSPPRQCPAARRFSHSPPT
ncbi:hypothetical protein RB195_022481 [Necator americanus]|uniref:Uncharacterized protein n=1 Tax=Necator americanus TaxID=51031 RepID=A0ABR1EFG5_NECAM